MVHALQRAAGRLRAGGMLISIRPHLTRRPSVVIVTGKRRLLVATLLETNFERNLDAAESALRRVVEESAFSSVGVRSARFRSYLERPSQMRRLVHDFLLAAAPGFTKCGTRRPGARASKSPNR